MAGHICLLQSTASTEILHHAEPIYAKCGSMDIHQRLKEARLRAGFDTATAAAKHLNVPYGTYSGHESGQRGIKNEDVLKYAKAFNVTPLWLSYGGEDGLGKAIFDQLDFPDGHVGGSPDGKVSWLGGIAGLNFRLREDFDPHSPDIMSEEYAPYDFMIPKMNLGNGKLISLLVLGPHVKYLSNSGGVIYAGELAEKRLDAQRPCVYTNADGELFVGFPPEDSVVSAKMRFAPIMAIVTSTGRNAARDTWEVALKRLTFWTRDRGKR